MSSDFHSVKKRDDGSGIIGVFIYEVRMLNETCICIVTNRIMNKDHAPWEANAYIESFLLHARNLIYFFEGNGNPKYDLTCVDFNDVSGEKLKPIALNINKNVRNDISTYLSHMTKPRAQDSQEWFYLKIKEELNRASIFFIKSCSSSYFSSEADKESYVDLIAFLSAKTGDIT